MPLSRIQKRAVELYTPFLDIASSSATATLRGLPASVYLRLLHSSTAASERKADSGARSPIRPFDRQDKDVVPNDLEATLAAHRASNLASIIRDVGATTASRPWKSIDLPAVTKDRSEDKKLELDEVKRVPQEDETPGRDSIDAQEKASARNGEAPRRNASRPAAKKSSTVRTVSSGKKDKHVLRVIKKVTSGNVTDRAGWKITKVVDREHQTAKATHQNAHHYAVGAYVSPLYFRDKEVYTPWMKEKLIHMEDRRQRLDAELDSFSSWISLTPDELEFRNSMQRTITEAVLKYCGDVELETFGSHRTGLASPLSDIDIGFYLPSLQKDPNGERGPSPLRPEAQQKIRRKLGAIGRATEQIPNFAARETIFSARYPLFRMVHQPTGLEIQIVSARVHTDTVQTVENYIMEFPQLRTLYMVIKEALAARGLDDVRLGGLGSYSLLNMIVTSFKLKNISKTDSLGRCLITFLHFYAHFNTRSFCLSVDPPSIHPKRKSFVVSNHATKRRMMQDLKFYWQVQLSVEHEKQNWLLSLQDPADMTNDLTKSTLKILDIRATFGGMLLTLEQWLAYKDNHDKQWSPLVVFYGRALGRIRMQRNATARFLAGQECRKASTTTLIPRSEPEESSKLASTGIVQRDIDDLGKSELAEHDRQDMLAPVETQAVEEKEGEEDQEIEPVNQDDLNFSIPGEHADRLDKTDAPILKILQTPEEK